MNILEICLNPSLGGLELYFFWCAEYFKKSQHNVVAVTVPDSRLAALLKEHNVPTAFIEKKSPFATWRAARQLAQICDEKSIEVVHVHYKNDLPIVALAKKMCRRHIKIIHTRQMEMPGSKKDLYHHFIYSQLDQVLCITDKLKSEVLNRTTVPAEKVSRLYYGVKKPKGDMQRSVEFFARFPTAKIKVAMFSRIEKNKGQGRLLAALIELRKVGLDFQIYYFGHAMGDGFDNELKKVIAEHQLTESVYWCGFQKQPVDLMPFFDIVAMPSEKETFGLVLIEAMAAGVAIMGSNTGGVPEIIEDGVNGFSFPPDDIQQFAEKLKILILDTEKRKEFVAKSKAKYEELFTYEKHFSSLQEIFLKIINSSNT